MEVKFYRCAKCGKIIWVIQKSGCPTFCCGEAMQELIPGTVDASREKHVPVYTVENGIVKAAVGSVPHPMLDVHFIEWIAVRTKEGVQFKSLAPGMEPKAEFALTPGDEVIEVFEYCNLHGLWKA